MRPLGALDREEAALNERSYRAEQRGSIVDAPAGRVGSEGEQPAALTERSYRSPRRIEIHEPLPWPFFP
jgi:hypothetical protein